MLGKIIGGRYQLTRYLGGGGFGQTYLAEDQHLPGKPHCVVKQLKPRMSSPDALHQARRLFDTEAEVLYTLGSHEQIPRLFAHLEENQDFFLVQEFVEGEVLNRELKARKQFSEPEVLDLLQEILTVLEFVHQQHVVHRDIKPSNLIRRQSDGRIVLIDFGAVKQIGSPDEGLTEATLTIAVGSSGYMPNEQLAGKPRCSSDIYAVGMLAIQCLTGIYPRKLREDPKTSEIIWRDQVQVSSELAELVDTMVRYDYRQRYPSAREALHALQAITGVTPVETLLAEPKPISLDGHLVWLERGDELVQQQRYREAVTAYDHVLQAIPDDYTAWFKRGIALENLNCYEDAAASYDRVIQLQPEDYLAWYKRGTAFRHLQNHQAALQSYERVVQLQPENYWAWHDRGKILESLQQPDEAAASYDRAVQLKPDFELALKSRKRLLSQMRRIDTLYHLQHYDEAVASCDQAIEQNPSDGLAWLMRGMALENLQQYEEAVASYDQVVQIQPDDHVAWFKRGNLLEKLQRYEDAISSYYKVVQIQPDNYWAWHDRGRLLEQLKQFEDAIASYDQAVQLKPDLQEAVEGRRRVLRHLQSDVVSLSDEEDETIVSAGAMAPFSTSRLNGANNNLGLPLQADQLTVPTEVETIVGSPRQLQEVGVAHSSQTASIDTGIGRFGRRCDTTPLPVSGASTPLGQPGDSENPQETMISPGAVSPTSLEDYRQWLQRGRALEKSQRHAEALHAYNQASQIRTDDPALWRLQGNVLYTLQRYDAAVVSYNQALQLKPNCSDTWGCLGGTFARLKRHQEALTSFNRAIQIQPDRHTLWYWRGRVLCDLKQHAEALQSFEQAIRLKPDFQAAVHDRQRVQHWLQALIAKSEIPHPAPSATASEPESDSASV